MSQECRRDLEMLQVIISKGYCLARRDTVRELSSVCSRVSSSTRRLYLKASEKILFLHLND